jgi:hypothetical protein
MQSNGFVSDGHEELATSVLARRVKKPTDESKSIASR